ncbi:MAG: serine/threonine protein kinase [Kofleriaceae bacterium]
MGTRGDRMDPQQGPPQADLLIGQTIGNYLVKQKLGEGGMGAVYLAEHPTIGKKVALKVLHSEFSSNQDVAARFFNEAKAVNDIGHPNIVDIVDFGIIQAGPGREQLVYFIMEYLAGMTLSQLIRAEAPIAPERALSIALQVGDALAASHRCGIVHRDLKPDNIILTQRGRERDFVKLLDFGIAKLTSEQAGSRRTRTGIVMGTPAYMSPEQCEGRGNIDHRTDIYALGIVLYEMLIGRVPFLGEGYGEVLVQHLTQPPVPLSQFRMMNAHVEAVVMKALEKRVDLRYPTMDEMMRALADPVGYVESHGGVVGFTQRPLMPSTGPVPAAPVSRLTPAPFLTPTPGSLTPTPVPGGPTTLGGSAGEVQGGRGKKGFLVLGGVVIVGAIAAIAVVVATKSKDPAPPTPGSGSAVAAVADAASQEPPPAPPDASAPVAVDAAAAGSASGSAAGSGDTGSAAGSASGSAAGSASGSAAGSASTPSIPAGLAKLTLTTRPVGVRVFVDHKELAGVRTPGPFTLPLSDKPVKITLRSTGYEDLDVLLPSLTGDFQGEYKLKRKAAANPGRGSNTGPDGPSNDTGLMRPD